MRSIYDQYIWVVAGIILDVTNQLEGPYFAEIDNICYRIQPCIVCIDIKYELNLKTFHNDCNRSYYIVSSIFLVYKTNRLLGLSIDSEYQVLYTTTDYRKYGNS